MGMFSFITQDTDRSIWAEDDEFKGTEFEAFTVYMIDDKGNKWKETAYEGYGRFGGKDFYELLAEMNGKTTREDGITLFFDGKYEKSPMLVENPNTEYEPSGPEECPYQGYPNFEDDEEEDYIGFEDDGWY